MPVSKPMLVLLSAVFVSTAAAQLLNDILSRVSSERQVEFCPLDPPVTVVYCMNGTGESVASQDDRMPAMSECVVATEDGETSTMVCLNNGIKVKTKQLQHHKEHHRVKKGFMFRRAFRWLGRAARFVGDVFVDIVTLPFKIVFGFLCLFLCSGGGGPPPNQLPTLTCASLQGPNPVFPNKGDIDAIVTWTPATASDPEDGSLTVKNVPETFTSGKRYSAGNYSLSFYAQDKSSGGAQCSISFQVKVTTCDHPGWPSNGGLECTNHFTVYGRGCNIVCDAGHELPSGSMTSIECTASKTWNTQIPDCTPVACKPKPTVPNGHIQCPKGAYFNKRCGVVCEEGHIISGENFVECNKQGEWPATIPQCKDVQPPLFTYCPSSPIQVDIDAANNTAYVEWDEPQTSDNSGDPTVTERNGQTFGRYEAGTHLIVYDIEDAAGNKGQSCVFTIDVQSISCDPPALDVVGKEHMKYICPDLYRFGAECSLACKSGYPLVGVNKIQCLNVANANPPELQWTWDQSGLDPYCKVSTCADLDAPANGALACDQWLYGNTCQMQCQGGFDVPYLPIGGGLFVCSTTNGDWIPNIDPPDCIVHDGTSDLKMGADFYYYTGVCNSSPENLKEIQENFISALSSSAYQAVCIGHDKCQSRFVSVVCGPVSTTGRKKRNVKLDIERRETEEVNPIKNDERHNIEKRSTELVYKIAFELILSIDTGSKTTSQAMTDTENVLYTMYDEIQTEVDAGKFDIAGLEVKSDSLGVGAAQLDCATGMEARVQTASCVGCGYGRFYSTNTSDCELCPIGTYQDQAHSLTCTSCPDNTTTLYTSTRNSSDCLRHCLPGEYSATGLAPCAKCPSTKYQPDYRQTNCTACPALKRSDVIGATGQQQCKDYDVQLKLGKPVNVGSINITSTVVSAVTWLSLSSTSGRQTLTSLVSSDKTFDMSIQYNAEIVVVINGEDEATGVKLQPHRWTQFAVTVDSDRDTVTVYINGNSVHTSSSFDIARGVAAGDKLIVDADVQLSGYQMASSLLTSTDLQTWSSQCHFSVSDTFISIDDLAKSQNVKSVVPSKCDAVDECLSSPCGSHGVCTNLQTGYECSCTGGYTGITCQDRPDPCLSNVCKNGATCTALITNYTCDCPYGYRGDLCEFKAVDGKMSAWSDWSGCSHSCGGGLSSRSRACDSPTPDPEGRPCSGDTTETRDCNEGITCPECLRLRRPRGATAVVCNTTDTLKRCHIQCQQGYELPEDSPIYYDCGAVTNYTWSHQTDDNPKARLPACSVVKAPAKLGFASTTKYGNLTCQDESTVLQQLNVKLGSMPCASSAGCFHSVTTNCNSDGRKKRSTGSLDVTISIKSEDIPSGINIQELFDNDTVSDEFVELLQAIYNVETTVQDMFNDTTGFYNVTVNGVEYSVTELLDASSDITCQPGSAPFSSFCVESPVGSYSDGLSVIMCSRGTYQDEIGSSSCKQCPTGFTTLEVGAESIDECSVTDDNSVDQTPPASSQEASQESSDNTAVIVGSVIGGLVVLIGIGLGILIGIKLAQKGKRQVGRSCEDLQNVPYSNVYKPKFNPEKLNSGFPDYLPRPTTATSIELNPKPY